MENNRITGFASIDWLEGDITKIRADAIANSASRSLRGGGGVDGAIHKAAGPRLSHACLQIGSCEIGGAVVTRGFNLPARLIVHTAAPRRTGHDTADNQLLALCYRSVVLAADAYGATSLAIPAIGSGVRGFDAEASLRIGLDAIRDALKACKMLRAVSFVASSHEVSSALKTIIPPSGFSVATSEYWYPDWIGIDGINISVWVSILGMEHHEWAIINKSDRGHEILFCNDYGAVFDRIKISKIFGWLKFLTRNGFEEWAPGTEVANFISPPRYHLHLTTIDPRYSGMD